MKNFIKQFTKKEIVNLGKVIQFRSDYFLIPSEVKEVLKKTKHKPAFVGIFLGKKKKFFHPSPYLLNLLSKNTDKTTQVNSKGEWMFICGRNVHDASITKKNDLQPGEFTLVLNQHNECIGYAKITANPRIPLENIFDLGNFLRRERKK